MIIADPRGLWQPPGMGAIDDWEGRPPAGWIPVDISLGHPTIRWIKAGSAPLMHPFFDESVQDLRRGIHPAPEHETLFDPAEAQGTWGTVDPSGIVFHISRCGSTLLANALRAFPDIVVLSEAPPMDSVLAWIASPAAYWAALGTKMLPAITALFANYRPPNSRSVVLKCAPEGIVALSAVRAMFPGIPCVVIIRNPIEVLVSNVTTPPRWVIEWYEAPRHRCLGTPPAAAFDDGFTGFCAWVIGQWCSAALAALDDSCWVLDYADLVPDTALGIAEVLGFRPDPRVREEVSGVFRRNAKRPGSAFEQDSERKRLAADAVMVRSAKRWADEPYRALLSRAQRVRRTSGGSCVPEL